MSKLKLRLENLKVESFETSEVRAGRGTVLGASILPATEAGPCPDETQITGPCCDVTLAISCVLTNCIAACNSFGGDVCLG